MTSIFENIQRLLNYGVQEKLLRQEDVLYSRNRILAVLGIYEWKEVNEEQPAGALAEILEEILDWAFDNQVITNNTITERDIFDTEIMNCLMPRPSEVIDVFNQKFSKKPKNGTDYFYHLSLASNYIRQDRIEKNIQWKTNTPFGNIDITINLSKPEKDPKEIALLKNAPAASYPICLLCKENEGYKGNLRHPARATHRIIPLYLNKEDWYLQYSPYVYYNEHSIIFRREHIPMKISRETFIRLLDFTEQFPHYFIGSNADLPIVGGSILSHDHFQGGRYQFAIEKAEIEETITLLNYPSVSIGIVRWPMSVLRVCGPKHDVAEVSQFIWNIWKGYTDEHAGIFAFSGDTPHNTVTPISRRNGELFEMDIVLRNNRTSEEFPEGIFHPHRELHHIKKENIGLIEVMGLAVLPGRLGDELKRVAENIITARPKEEWEEMILKHWEWAQKIIVKRKNIHRDNVMSIIQEEVGYTYLTVLEHAGVFKRTAEGKQAFLRFLEALQGQGVT
ncbi:UDP-glucose--hexose-1-phosphate uridylyltransferase [Peribacillus sp. SCS-155]|uniref:UDP-glucose--hexose-1-phosphate uridylyltransferase n=1 Tax=Peribacillus sedimenti TaxID=3115297 RepID=UPI0039064134